MTSVTFRRHRLASRPCVVQRRPGRDPVADDELARRLRSGVRVRAPACCTIYTPFGHVNVIAYYRTHQHSRPLFHCGFWPLSPPMNTHLRGSSARKWSADGAKVDTLGDCGVPLSVSTLRRRRPHTAPSPAGDDRSLLLAKTPHLVSAQSVDERGRSISLESLSSPDTCVARAGASAALQTAHSGQDLDPERMRGAPAVARRGPAAWWRRRSHAALTSIPDSAAILRALFANLVLMPCSA